MMCVELHDGFCFVESWLDNVTSNNISLNQKLQPLLNHIMSVTSSVSGRIVYIMNNNDKMLFNIY